MASFQEALKQVDKIKVAVILQNLPSSDRYKSEQMDVNELRNHTKDNNSLSNHLKRVSNGHFSGRHLVPVKNAVAKK